jgi:hypothetical protein
MHRANLSIDVSLAIHQFIRSSKGFNKKNKILMKNKNFKVGNSFIQNIKFMKIKNANIYLEKNRIF